MSGSLHCYLFYNLSADFNCQSLQVLFAGHLFGLLCSASIPTSGSQQISMLCLNAFFFRRSRRLHLIFLKLISVLYQFLILSKHSMYGHLVLPVRHCLLTFIHLAQGVAARPWLYPESILVLWAGWRNSNGDISTIAKTRITLMLCCAEEPTPGKFTSSQLSCRVCPRAQPVNNNLCIAYFCKSEQASEN